MNTPTIKTLIGNRILIRRVDAEYNRVLPKATADNLMLQQSANDREAPFEAMVFAVGAPLSEDLKPGDTVILAAPPSQDRVGTRRVLWNGEPCELVSTLDVIGKVEP